MQGGAGRKASSPISRPAIPRPTQTAALVAALERGGADLIELGVPFSDPIADGPVIQRASDRALRRRHDAVRACSTSRARSAGSSEIPLLLFSYLNPLLRYGFEQLARDAAAAGIDGVSAHRPERGRSRAVRRAMREHGLDTVFLAAPDQHATRRLELVARVFHRLRLSGFAHRRDRRAASLSERSRRWCERMRELTDLPLAVGFGISTPEQVAEVARQRMAWWSEARCAAASRSMAASPTLAGEARSVHAGLTARSSAHA